MIRTDISRNDSKRRAAIDYKKRQFAKAEFQHQNYELRLNFYTLPPTAEITLEQFETWAIDRLKVLSELNSCTYRNRTPEETTEYMRPILEKYLPLHHNSSKTKPATLQEQRIKDHYSHFILRLVFASSDSTRDTFARLEKQLFSIRFKDSDLDEKTKFVKSLDLDWEDVGERERKEMSAQLATLGNAAGGKKQAGSSQGQEEWFKVDFWRVPELVERRQVVLRMGKAYVRKSEQGTLIAAEFLTKLNESLELTSRAIPRLDEDDRLAPILEHLSSSFLTPETTYDDSASSISGLSSINAASIDTLSTSFPLCMRSLHMDLRQNSHLKHFGRLQYGLFLKGLGLSLEESLQFWRRSFKNMTDEKFNKEYKYNIRHSYGDVGGDANRRGRGYTPFSCQKLLTEPLPGPGQSHGCPYRTFTEENLVALLQRTGVNDRELLQNIKEDKKNKRFHIACNRVFEWSHAKELRKVKDEGSWAREDLDTILHPNTYFKRSWLLRHLGQGNAGVVDGGGSQDVDKMEE